MADRFNEYGELVLTELRGIKTAIQKTQSYIDAHSYAFDASSVVEVSATSGAIGGIAVDVQFDGSVAVVSSASGAMNASYFWGVISAVPTVTGMLVVLTDLIGTVAGVSSATAAPLRDFRETLVGGAGGVSAASGTIIISAVNIDASVSAVSAASGSMTLAWALAGSADAVSVVPTIQMFINGEV